MHSPLVVLGGGPGGYAAAFLAADQGMEVTIVESSPVLGGACLMHGCIPSKALLHVAHVMREARELQTWGVDIENVVIDVDRMRAQKETVLRRLAGGLGQLAKGRKVNLVQARGTLIDNHTLKLDGSGGSNPAAATLSFDHLILATGSRPAVPGPLAVDSDRVMDSTAALELKDVPDRLLVVGGGYIGLEMATVYSALGSQVTVVELTDGLLPGVDRDLVRNLQRRLSSQLSELHLGTQVQALTAAATHVMAQCGKAGESWAGEFDRVLIAVGRRPNSDGLGLENTAIQLDDRGFVVTDDQLRTAESHICAIGDLAGEPMLAHKASHQGRLVVAGLQGQVATFGEQVIPAVVFTDPEIAWCGITEQTAKQTATVVETAMFPWAASGRAQAVGRPDGLTKWFVEPGSERLLGCGIVGVGAGELIAEATLAVQKKLTVKDITSTIHPHPTMSETVLASAEAFYGTATEIYKPRRPG